jgi:protein-L-isoaspartate(D-aspartate) O-methyltransferase
LVADDNAKEYLINALKGEKILKAKHVEDALRSVRREDFLWQGESIATAYMDQPLGLGETGQTISAPHMVTIMLEEADLRPGLHVLEVGTGSGYNAALIAFIVSRGIQDSIKEPLVTSIERNEKLAHFARQNLERAKLDKFIEVIEGDGSLGYPEGSKEMLYDRIIVTAGAPFIPPHLESQLKINGILLIPVGNGLYQNLIKERKILGENGKAELVKEKLMAVMFVPLVGEDGGHR